MKIASNFGTKSIFFLLVLVSTPLLATIVHAAGVDAGKGAESLLEIIRNNANSWAVTLRSYALNLFWLLAVIQLIWTFFPLVMKQADLSEIAGELVRFILVTGFFFALLVYSVDWANAIVESFRKAGAAAAGLGGQSLYPGDIFWIAIRMGEAIASTKTGWSPSAYVGVTVAALLVTVCFTFISVFLITTLVESYIVINASVLFMGFGGSQWTREYALVMARYAVSVGAKLFVLTLIVGIVYQSSLTWANHYDNQLSSMWTMVGLSVLCAYLTKQIPDLIQGLISGTSMGGGNTIGSMASIAAAAAATTVASVAATAAVGGAATKAATKGLSVGSGSASFGSRPGLGGASPVAQNLFPKVGGHSRNTSSKPLSSQNASSSGMFTGKGSKNNSSFGTNSKAGTSTSSKIGSKDSSSISESENKSIFSQKAAPSIARPIANATHKTARSAVRSVGNLAAFSVPGMEQSAGLDIGPSPLKTNEEGRASEEEFRSNLSDSQNTGEENTIAPAEQSTDSEKREL